MSNRDVVLDFLRSISPRDATNAEIVARTGVRPHQQVFQITKDLYQHGVVRGSQGGGEWRFWAADDAAKRRSVQPAPSTEAVANAARVFEKRAQRLMSELYGVPLAPGKVPGVPKAFDLVSADKTIVGDAKFYTMVNGVGLPPAKFATIAEYVWLLEKTFGAKKFLVFGNERRVPEEWLARFGRLVSGIEFYFLGSSEVIERLSTIPRM